jgi:hypothetical protein
MASEARFHEECFKEVIETNDDGKLAVKESAAHRIKWFENSSPDVGEPDCICSWCGKQIGEDECPPRLWRGLD